MYLNLLACHKWKGSDMGVHMFGHRINSYDKKFWKIANSQISAPKYTSGDIANNVAAAQGVPKFSGTTVNVYTLHTDSHQSWLQQKVTNHGILIDLYEGVQCTSSSEIQVLFHPYKVLWYECFSRDMMGTVRYCCEKCGQSRWATINVAVSHMGTYFRSHEILLNL